MRISELMAKPKTHRMLPKPIERLSLYAVQTTRDVLATSYRDFARVNVPKYEWKAHQSWEENDLKGRIISAQILNNHIMGWKKCKTQQSKDRPFYIGGHGTPIYNTLKLIKIIIASRFKVGIYLTGPIFLVEQIHAVQLTSMAFGQFLTLVQGCDQSNNNTHQISDITKIYPLHNWRHSARTEMLNPIKSRRRMQLGWCSIGIFRLLFFGGYRPSNTLVKLLMKP